MANTKVKAEQLEAAQTNITSLGTLTSLTISGDLTVDTSTLKVDSSNNRVGIGTTSPSTSLDIVRAGVQPLRLESSNGTEVAINMVNTGGNVQLEAHSGNFTIDAAKLSIASTSTPAQLNVYEASNSQMQFQTSATGTGTSGGARFGYNGSGAQIWNFENNYVRFATNNAERVRIDASGNVGIGTTNPKRMLQVGNNTQAIAALSLQTTTSGLSRIYMGDNDSTSAEYVGLISYAHSIDAMQFFTSGNERVRINNTGEVGIGGEPVSTSSGYDGAQLHIRQSASNGGAQLFLTEANNGNTGTDGVSISVWNDGHAYMQLLENGAWRWYMDSSLRYGWSKDHFYPEVDNAIDIGLSNKRFDDIYATNGNIQTSDETLKRDINELSEAEKKVALKIKGLMRTFRWKSSYEEKGNDARYHTGVIAQQVEALFKEEGLDVSKYAFWVKGVYYVDSEGKELADEYGGTITPDIDAFKEVTDKKEAYRYSIRYEELLCFIIGAM